MNQPGDAGQPHDAFSRFWTDMMSRAAAAGMAAPFASARPEAMKQMRQSFFEAWAAHCDEVMRSEQFLEAMKQSMDAALLFRQQVNQFLTRCVEDAQLPSRTDSDALMRVMRSVEERVLDRLDALHDRLEKMESRLAAVENGQDVQTRGAKPARKT